MANPSSSSSVTTSRSSIDPIVHTALRYTLNDQEYRLLHHYLLSRSVIVRRKAPPPKKYSASLRTKDDFNAAAVRASVRVFTSSFVILKLWETIKSRLVSRPAIQPATKRSLWRSDKFRLSSSLSLILLFHRLFYRFLTRLRESLLTDNARPFRRRNPRVTRTLIAKVTPAIGASLAGFFLAVAPADQLRLSAAIYLFSRALEFAYNALEDRGHFSDRPWWFGSWMLVPPALGQLLHAFVFDRDCFPASFGNFILGRSGPYLQGRPADYPASLDWPGSHQIVDSLAEISRLRWPAFVSPILFPLASVAPKSLMAISPIISPAHPSIKNLSCAVLHPSDPSCLRTYVTYYAQVFPGVARFFTIIFGVFAALRYKALLADPLGALNKLSRSILRMSLFVTGAIGTSWGSICFFQQYLPKGFLSTQRWFLGGFIGGLWAILERKSGRGNALYTARLSMDSLWKVGVKRGWWRGLKNGDVLVFVASLALISGIYERRPMAVAGPVVRKSLGFIRGDGFVDQLSDAQLVLNDTDEAVLQARDVKDEGTELDKEKLAES